MHNATAQCDRLSEVNQTEPRVTVPQDTAGCLFLSIMPYTDAVPALIWIFALLTLLSLLFNGLSLVALGRSEDLSWEPRVAFFKNLILSDLMQTVTISPGIIHSLVQRRTVEFSIWCNMQYFVGAASIFSSLVTITVMALERYVYVCHAIHYLVILSRMRLRLVVGLIWIYSISISTINLTLLHTGRAQETEQVTRGLVCEPDIMEQHMGFPRASAVFRKVIGPLTLLLCLLVHGFCYTRMYQEARKAMIPFNAVNTVARKTVLFYCGMVFLQLLPLLLKSASDALWEVEGNLAMTELSSQSHGVPKSRPAPSAMAAALHMSLLIFVLVPPCINPLVYGMRNMEMRQALLRPFRWWMERRRADV